MPRKPSNRTPGVYALPGGGYRYMVRDQDGRQHWHSLDEDGERYQTKATAYQARLAHLARIANPSPTWSKDSLGAFLETWEPGRPNLKANSRITDQSRIKRAILPQLGAVPLAELSPAHIRAWHAGLADRYAPSTINATHMLLSAALNDAVDWDLIPRNVARRVTPPAAVVDIPDPWLPDQVRAFLLASDGHKNAAVFRLLLSTGLRIGELLALRWRDIDWQGRQVTIARTITRNAQRQTIIGDTTKSAAGRRTVPLTDLTLTLLRQHQDRQAFVRHIAGSAWQDDDLVFCSRRGRRLDPGTIRDQFTQIIDGVTMPDGKPLAFIRLHDLRHTAATLMLSSGTPVHIVSRILGHASPSVTLALYAHYLPHYGRVAVDDLERLFGEG